MMKQYDTDDFRQSLQPMLVNRDHEKELLSRCPHRDLTDEIACIAYSTETKTLVDRKSAAEHSMTGQEVLDQAIQNQMQHSYHLSSIEKMLGVSTETVPSSLLVLTNNKAFCGSSEVLNQTAMDEAANKLQSDKLFVIPSSVHEVLLFPENGGISADQFNELINSINQNEVKPQDRLANRVMLYDKKTHRLADAEEVLHEEAVSEETQLHSPERRHHV